MFMVKIIMMRIMVISPHTTINDGNANNDDMAAVTEKPKCDRKYPPEAQTAVRGGLKNPFQVLFWH